MTYPYKIIIVNIGINAMNHTSKKLINNRKFDMQSLIWKYKRRKEKMDTIDAVQEVCEDISASKIIGNNIAIRNIQIDDLFYVEQDLDFYEKVNKIIEKKNQCESAF